MHYEQATLTADYGTQPTRRAEFLWSGRVALSATVDPRWLGTNVDTDLLSAEAPACPLGHGRAALERFPGNAVPVTGSDWYAHDGVAAVLRWCWA